MPPLRRRTFRALYLTQARFSLCSEASKVAGKACLVSLVILSKGLCLGRSSSVHVDHVSVDEFGHGEHVNPIGLEDAAHSLVADDEALISRILQVVSLDVPPQSFRDFGSRELQTLVWRKDAFRGTYWRISNQCCQLW
jgi:hypothetical protein